MESHLDQITETDFFTTEVWTSLGLVTYYILFFIRLSTRRVQVVGITPHPNEEWMTAMAWTILPSDRPLLSKGQYLIHDRDKKFCWEFKDIVRSAGVKLVQLPAKSPNLKGTGCGKPARPGL